MPPTTNQSSDAPASDPNPDLTAPKLDPQNSPFAKAFKSVIANVPDKPPGDDPPAAGKPGPAPSSDPPEGDPGVPKPPAKPPADPPAEPPKKDSPPQDPPKKDDPDGDPGDPGEPKPRFGAKPDDDDPPEGLSKKATDRWKQMRERHVQLNTELDEARGRIRELEDKATQYDPKEIEQLRQQVKEADDMIKRASLEGDPRWRAKFEKNLNSLVTEAKNLTPGEHSDVIEQVLRMPEGKLKQTQLAEIYSDMEDNERDELRDVVRQVRKLSNEREDYLKDWREQHEALLAHDAEATRKAQEAKEAELKKAERLHKGRFERILEAAADPKSGLEEFTKREGDLEWNEKVVRRQEEAKEFMFGQKSELDISTMVVKGCAYDGLAERAALLAEKVERQAAQLKELTHAEPQGRAQPTTSAPKQEGFVQRVREAMQVT